MYKKYRITFIDYEQEEGLEDFTVNTVDTSIGQAAINFYKEYKDLDVSIKDIKELDDIS